MSRPGRPQGGSDRGASDRPPTHLPCRLRKRRWRPAGLPIALADEAVAVGNRVTPAPPHRSQRAAFPHWAPVEGRTRPKFGAWAAHAPPIRRLAASGACRFRFCARDMRRRSSSLRPAAFPPPPPPPALCRHCSGLHRYYAAVRLLTSPAPASSLRLPGASRSCLSGHGQCEVSQVPTTFPSYVMGSQTTAERLHLA